MTLITDAGLALINSLLSVAILGLVLGLSWSLRHYMPLPLLSRKAEAPRRLHSIAGSIALLLCAVLGVVTSTGPLLRVIQVDWTVTLQVVTLSLRLAILIVLLAWVAAAVQGSVTRRWPKVGDRLDTWLRITDWRHTT